jgi:GNAT superfamily N-acetyltransferase
MQERDGKFAVNMMTFRYADSADAENIARLVNLAFNPERFFIDGDRTDPNEVRKLLQKGRFLLAEESGVLIGCIYVELRGERGYFGLLAIEPARQKAGLGRRLIEAAEDYCRAAGCLFMDLTIVNLRLQLPAYYRRLGYAEIGTLPFPEHQSTPKVPCHLVRMSKALR